ncbi:hypothetical protein GLAREA_10943 [Glarea lozoyensis ATCC 20868]|nr:uncharacterized protein GLAREA_10943 [Glarea lozoyensis ATCC 20868]EPE35246.1 hypothetical protein GLAREA_10943 [Glarea lozoyensis ATCC 20868]
MSPSMDSAPNGTSTGKIAIKGFSLASKSSKPLVKPTPSSSLGKRPRAAFHADDGSDSENERRGNGRGKHESVTGFGEGGAIKKGDEERRRREQESVLVIPKLGNRDWKSEVRQRKGGSKNLLPPEVQRQREMAARQREGGKAEGVDVVNSKDGEIQWGLSVRKREQSPVTEVKTEKDVDVKVEEQADIVQETPKTADEEALAALLGERKEKKGPDLVIPTAVTNEPEQHFSEEDAYKRAVALAPDVSTLEDYERVPVEEFGAALLRGMGWKGQKEGKIKEVKRRQNLLGLGAKELKDAEELGAWVQKSDVKRLNERRGPGGGGERRPRVNEYKREKERRDEKREERGGGYRRERERDRDEGSSGRYRDGERDRYRERR